MNKKVAKEKTESKEIAKVKPIKIKKIKKVNILEGIFYLIL